MFRCRDLLSLPTLSRAKLIAGEKGLENGIRWSYKAENMNFASWVHGQELLVVSTPVINSSDFDLHRLIENAIRLKLSGVLLLVGEEYVSSIAMKSLKLADINGLPVISLPGNTPLVDVFEELGHAIVFQEKRQLVNDDILAGIVFGNQIDPTIINRQTELLGYDIRGRQRGFMIHMSLPEDINTQDLMGYYLEKLQELFPKYGSMAVVSHFHFNIVGITGEEDEQKLKKILEEFYSAVQKKDSSLVCRIGVGIAYEELTMLGKSFAEASSVIKLANPIQWYEKLGFLKLLLSTENQKQLADYSEQILGNIIAYDKKNNSELISTLEAYFDCNENMKEAGAKIYVHPNTVKYRLTQIQDMSGLSLSITHEKMELYNALQSFKIVEIEN